MRFSWVSSLESGLGRDIKLDPFNIGPWEEPIYIKKCEACNQNDDPAGVCWINSDDLIGFTYTSTP